jgi:signal transduction histidine kinase
VAADRASVASEFDSYLREQVSQISVIATLGRERLPLRPDLAKQAFKDIQDTGRAALVHMRDVVGNLRDDAPMTPQPVLSQLDRLLGGITRADARLRMEGDPCLLPPGVELSGYRIIEHALLALENDPAAHVDVVVELRPDSLQLTVVGPSARAAEVRAALGAAKERAALHGGTLRSEAQGAFRKTVVQLPIVAWHA